MQLLSCLAYQEGAKQFVVALVVFQFPVTTVSKGRPPKKNGKKDDIMHISNYPLPPCLIVTTERMTNHSNQ